MLAETYLFPLMLPAGLTHLWDLAPELAFVEDRERSFALEPLLLRFPFELLWLPLRFSSNKDGSR